MNLGVEARFHSRSNAGGDRCVHLSARDIIIMGPNNSFLESGNLCANHQLLRFCSATLDKLLHSLQLSFLICKIEISPQFTPQGGCGDRIKRSMWKCLVPFKGLITHIVCILKIIIFVGVSCKAERRCRQITYFTIPLWAVAMNAKTGWLTLVYTERLIVSCK